MHDRLAAETELVAAALSPVRWRRAFAHVMTNGTQKREQTDFRLMAYVALTAASAPCFPVALHVIFRF